MSEFDVHLASAARSLVVLLCCLGQAGCGPDSGEASTPVAVSAPSANRPDVVMITLDTTRRDHIGCYGRTPSLTPNIDRLCARARRFDNAVAVAPVTLPAHASMMTGRYPPAHGARYNGETQLPSSATTLAELLAQQGYATSAFVSSFGILWVIIIMCVPIVTKQIIYGPSKMVSVLNTPWTLQSIPIPFFPAR